MEWSILAESDKYQVAEGNINFPPESVKREYFRGSGTDYECHMSISGEVMPTIIDIVVDGKVNKDAVWYYPDPKPAAIHIKGHVAFDTGKGMIVER